MKTKCSICGLYRKIGARNAKESKVCEKCINKGKFVVEKKVTE